jgi:YHS domain-containing protein
MKPALRSAAKACLVTAASGLLCSQVAGLILGDDFDSSEGGRRRLAVQLAEATLDEDDALVEQPAPGPGPAGETEVQKQLRAIYKKNGREMPSMNLSELPGTQVPSAGAGSGDQPTSPVAVPRGPKANWFERTFHVGKGKRPAAPTTTSTPRPGVKSTQKSALPVFNPAPAPVAAPAPAPAPTPRPAASPIRTQMNYPGARPAMPMYRPNPGATQAYQNPPAPVPPVVHQPPIGSQSNVSAAPARQQYHEPAPLAPVVTPSERSVAATPPTVRPGVSGRTSQPLLDESGIKGDAESLDLESDDAKIAAQAPKMLASPAAKGAAESPYSGLKISPNDIEQQADAALSAAPTPAVPAVAPNREVPAVAATPAAAAKSAAPAAKVKNADLGLDEEDSDEGDGETISLPAPDAQLQRPADPDKMIAAVPVKGLKGLCPVLLKDDRKLIDAQAGISSEYRGKIYHFSSVDAKRAFDENPKKYSPAGDGNDVVQLVSGEKKAIEGTLDHAAWYRGRLYLFASPESRLEFVETPSKFVLED